MNKHDGDRGNRAVRMHNADRMVRPESRASYLVRIEIDQATAGGPVDLAAGDAIQAGYAAISARQDLFPPDVLAAVETAARARATIPPLKAIGVAPDPTAADAGLRPYYRSALFAIPAIGQVAPPQRSPWGWDLILWTDVRRPPPLTRELLAAQLFELVRQNFFLTWVAGLEKQHAVTRVEAAPPTRPR